MTSVSAIDVTWAVDWSWPVHSYSYSFQRDTANHDSTYKAQHVLCECFSGCSLPLFFLLELHYCYVSQVCECVCECFSYFPAPPLTAHQLCRHSDSAGVPPVQLLSSSRTSSLIEPRWNNWSPNPSSVIYSSLWQLLSLLFRMTDSCRYTFSCILWAGSQTKVFIQASDDISAVDGPYHFLCLFPSWFCKRGLIRRGIVVCCNGVYLRRFDKR